MSLITVFNVPFEDYALLNDQKSRSNFFKEKKNLLMEQKVTHNKKNNQKMQMTQCKKKDFLKIIGLEDVLHGTAFR